MWVTPHERQNTAAVVEATRQRMRNEGLLGREVSPVADRAQRFFEKVAGKPATGVVQVAEEAAPPPLPAPVLTAEEIAEAARQFGLTRLDDLTTAHMEPVAAKTYVWLLEEVRRWRQTETSQAFVLCSKGKGVGKTHIAKAVMDSYSFLHWTGERPSLGEQANGPEGAVVMERRGIMLSARQCMEMVGEDEGWRQQLIGKRIVVLDDVGREGTLKFIKQDKEAKTQQLEKQARYYEFFNVCYEHKLRLFVTSNLAWGQLGQFFNQATWSRLNEMAPVGCVFELADIPDYRLLKSGRGN